MQGTLKDRLHQQEALSVKLGMLSHSKQVHLQTLQQPAGGAPSTLRSQNLVPAVVPDFGTTQVHVRDGTVDRVHKTQLLQYLAAQGHGSYYSDKSTKQALLEFIVRITSPGANATLIGS